MLLVPLLWDESRRVRPGVMQSSAAVVQAREQQRLVPGFGVSHHGHRQPQFARLGVDGSAKHQSVGGGHARAQERSTWADVVKGKTSADSTATPAVAVQEGPLLVAQAVADDNDENFDDSNLTVPEDLDYEAIRKQVWKIDRVLDRRIQKHATEMAAAESSAGGYS